MGKRLGQSVCVRERKRERERERGFLLTQILEVRKRKRVMEK